MADDSLTSTVRLYRELGFFGQYPDLSNHDLGHLLNGRHREIYRRDVDFQEPLADLTFLALDEERVWWHDMEGDLFPGNDAWVRIFQEWATVSRGAFRPEQVREHWEDEDGPVTISFCLNGQSHELRSDWLEWIDLGLLNEINRLIAPSGYFFDADIDTGDQTACIVVLTAGEKAWLVQKRPWLFFRAVGVR